MGQIAVALKHLMAAGLSGDALVHAIEEIEEAARPEPEDQPQRSKAAERQARYRERKKASQNVTNHNDVTSCDVTGDEDPLSPLGPPLSPIPPNPPYNPPNPDQSQGAGDFKLEPPEQPKPKRTARANGKRLSEDWQPTPKDLAFATKHGLTPKEIEDEANRFRNSWISKPGKDGRKLDWGRTWENWITNPTLGPIARKEREAKRAASRGHSTSAQTKPRSGGLAAAGVGLVAEARGFGQ